MSGPQAGGSLGLDVPLSRCHTQGQAFGSHRPQVGLRAGGWSQPRLSHQLQPLNKALHPCTGWGSSSSSHHLLVFQTHILETGSGKVKVRLRLCCEGHFPPAVGRGAALVSGQLSRSLWILCSECTKGTCALESTRPRVASGDAESVQCGRECGGQGLPAGRIWEGEGGI